MADFTFPSICSSSLWINLTQQDSHDENVILNVRISFDTPKCQPNTANNPNHGTDYSSDFSSQFVINFFHCEWCSKCTENIGKNGNWIYWDSVMFFRLESCKSGLHWLIPFRKRGRDRIFPFKSGKATRERNVTLPQNSLGSSIFCKGPRTSNVWESMDLKCPQTLRLY